MGRRNHAACLHLIGLWVGGADADDTEFWRRHAILSVLVPFKQCCTPQQWLERQQEPRWRVFGWDE